MNGADAPFRRIDVRKGHFKLSYRIDINVPDCHGEHYSQIGWCESKYHSRLRKLPNVEESRNGREVNLPAAAQSC
jgi:hypothetical protein